MLPVYLPLTADAWPEGRPFQRFAAFLVPTLPDPTPRRRASSAFTWQVVLSSVKVQPAGPLGRLARDCSRRSLQPPSIPRWLSFII